MSYNIAIVGATGNVGREIIKILHERNFPIHNIYAVASSKSIGKKISFGDTQVLEVQDLAKFDFAGIDIAFFSAGSGVSEVYAPKAAANDAIVIDNTSCFRMDEDVPLIVPEVNSQDIAKHDICGIISNPNCAAAQLAMVLHPLHQVFGIKRVVVTTMQSVSGAGKEAMDELFEQTKGRYIIKNVQKNLFPKDIAFNLFPKIGEFTESLYTSEEEKIINEIKKIVDSNIQVTATCVRVPVFIGHSESVNIEFETSTTREEILRELEGFPGIEVIDEPNDAGFVSPLDCVGYDEVYVSRIREDLSKENAFNLWIVSDNLRKGAALNAVQIAEELIEKYI